MIDTKVIVEGIAARLKGLSHSPLYCAALLVGDDPASLSFLRQKANFAEKVGIKFQLITLPENTSVLEIQEHITDLGRDSACGAIIVQLPLPGRIQRHERHLILNHVPPNKDPDVLGEASIGSFYTGRNPILPPSVAVVKEILSRERDLDFRKAKVVLIGAGLLIGRPIGFWLQSRSAKNRVKELVVLDDTVENLSHEIRDADVVVSGAGRGHLFGASHLKEGAIVMDFGFSRIDGKLCGDFDPCGAEKKRIRYTKTPGGTGPILVAKLFENFFVLCEAE